MSATGQSHGPAVLLATADSIFTATLAKDWLNRGLDVKVVTLGDRGQWLPPLPGGGQKLQVLASELWWEHRKTDLRCHLQLHCNNYFHWQYNCQNL